MQLWTCLQVRHRTYVESICTRRTTNGTRSYPRINELSLFPAFSSSLGALRHLGIHMNHQWSTLTNYSHVTDFSRLESLEIHDAVGAEMPYRLATYHLPALKHLSLHIIYLRLDGQPATEAVAIIQEAVINLIPALPALQSIKLGGPVDERTVRAVLDYCGHRLRRLLLSTYAVEETTYDELLVPTALVDVELIQEIQHECPKLEEMALTVLRSKDDANENAIYRALGTLASIRNIHLNIRFPTFFLRWPMNDDFTPLCLGGQGLNQDQETELSNALADIAMDRDLAQSIFRIISMSKPEYSPPLERVSFAMRNMEHVDLTNIRWTKPHLNDLLEYTRRSWTCTRNPRDDRRHDCFVTEYISAK